MKGKCSGKPAFHLLRWDHLATVNTTVMLPVQQPAEPPVSRASTSSALPAGSVLQAVAVPSAWFRPSCGQRGCSHFSVSPTHQARHLTAMTKLNKADSQSPFSIAGALQTALVLLKHGSCPDLSSCGDFGPLLTLQTPSRVATTQGGAEVFKHLGPKLGSSKLCSADDHSQRWMTSAEDPDSYVGVSQTARALPAGMPSLFLTSHMLQMKAVLQIIEI